jgi:hypothetical protein
MEAAERVESMKDFTIHAEAYGTYVTTVQASTPEEALEKSRARNVSWELADKPEVGNVVAVSCDGDTWNVGPDLEDGSEMLVLQTREGV